MPRRQQSGKTPQAGRGAPAAGRTPAFVQNPQYGGRAAAASSSTARHSPFRALNPAYWCCPRQGKAPPQRQTPTTPTHGQPSPKPRRDAPRNVKGVYLAQPQRILFYHKHDPHYGFTNFSDHPVTYQGKVYPTSEHLFQALKVRSRTAIEQRRRLTRLRAVSASQVAGSRAHPDELAKPARCVYGSASLPEGGP